MAEHDVPAALDKIREVTKQMKLFMVGHSMGATILFSFLSQIKFCDYHKEVLRCFTLSNTWVSCPIWVGFSAIG